MNTISTDLAKMLAVRYSGFMDAIHSGNKNSIVVWGEMLLQVQDATGIELQTPQAINRLVEANRDK